MQVAIATLIGVMGTGLLTVFIQFMRMMLTMLNRLETKVDELSASSRPIVSRLARIETILGMNPRLKPPEGKTTEARSLYKRDDLAALLGGLPAEGFALGEADHRRS